MAELRSWDRDLQNLDYLLSGLLQKKKKKFVNPGSVSIVKIFMYFLKEMRSFGEVLSSVVT